MATKQHGSVKRLGPRYGRTLRSKLGKVEAEQKKKHKCPFCSAERVRRKAAGIWYCTKCDSTFAAKAYSASVSKKAVTSEGA